MSPGNPWILIPSPRVAVAALTMGLSWLGQGCKCSDADRSPSELSQTKEPPSSQKPDPPGPGAYPYPAEPTRLPPVEPPDSEAGRIRLQKYLVVDQFGYLPEMRKVAVVADPVAGWNGADSFRPNSSLEVRQWSDKKLVFEGKPKAWNGGKVDKASGDRGFWFDFSPVRAKGLYYVYDPIQRVRSYPFRIDKHVYRPVLHAATKMFYFNRANFEKKPPYSCVEKRCWSLGKDHMGPHQDSEARSVLDRNNPATERDLSGGWWDAGDTNKYVTFANDAVHQLLTAYEERPEVFTDDFGIPESDNGFPDLLDEVMVEVEWLKKMQPKDLKGGVLIKVGSVDDELLVPDLSSAARYYYPKPCSSSTIVAAGLFAHAALVLGGFQSHAEVAADLRARALSAWRFFQTEEKSDACDDGTIKSGDADRTKNVQLQDAVTAAVYLFALTGTKEFDDYVGEHYRITRPFQDERWSVYEQSQGDALLAYADLPNSNSETKKQILARKTALAEKVDVFGFKPELDLYAAYMRPDSYHWGSNNARAAYGNTNYDLVQHGLVSGKARTSYVERAAGMLHSFHGVNPMQLVYLTNMYAFGGEHCADEMFHAWFRDGHARWDNARNSRLGPAPGYVTGGPNADYCKDQPPQQACSHSPVREQPPGKAYVDTNTGWEPDNPFDKSWELTEPAIYYQASYVRLLSKFVH